MRSWRQQGQLGLEAKKPGRKPLKDAKDRRIEELERKLLIAEKLIEVQKKAQELLAAAQPADKP